jgi:hypothetical protein
VREKPTAPVVDAVDPLLRATAALCGGLVIATPVFFGAALLCAVFWPGAFVAEAWLLGLWALASALLARARSLLAAVCAALWGAGAACFAVVLVRLLVARGLPLDPVSSAVNTGFAVAAALSLTAGALLRRASGRLWSA